VKEKVRNLIMGGIVGLIVGGVASLISAQMIENTAEPEFCGSCHEMKPMFEAWEKGPHGPLGNRRGAIRAGCADCHLPHTNVLSYLLNKGKFGINDFVAHLFKEGYTKDLEHWIEKRKERDHYVFVSNCYRCHTNLPKNVLHEKLKKGEIKGNCLTCHWYVGHGFDFENNLKRFFKEEKKSKI
jgi:trimethylamine-N-oxide reductase (cytochrome c) cytochrome c-type subunit TorY